MARNKEITVLLLDTGPKMQAPIRYAARAVHNFILSKMLNKPAHEVALVFYGTTGTINPLNQEFRDNGDEGQYTSITMAQPLSPPTTDYLATLKDVRPEQGKSDFIDALTVAVDALYKAMNERPELEKATVHKRVILITDFLEAANEDEGFEFAEALKNKMVDKAVTLEVISLDDWQEDAGDEAAKKANKEALNRILPYVDHKFRSAREPLELLGSFRAKEYSATAYYSGPLTIGNLMTINVKVTKKTSQERIPTMSKFSDRSIADDATHDIIYDRVFKRNGGEDEEDIAPEEMGKGYKYGSQIVPFVKEAELLMKYSPEKSFQVIGEVSADSVPHALLTGDTWAVASEKGNVQSSSAVSALACALRETDSALLTRFVPRLNGEITIGLMAPLPSSAQHPDMFIMNHLPFEADVRFASFAAFQKKPELLPRKEQTVAMDGLIDSFTLADSKTERMAPELIPNPVLNRFLNTVGLLATNSDRDIPSADKDPVITQALEPQLDRLPGAARALQQLRKQFGNTHSKQEGDGEEDNVKTAAEALQVQAEMGPEGELGEQQPSAHSASRPLDVFDDLIERGKQEAAFSGLLTSILELVDSSKDSRNHSQVIQCVLRLRRAAVIHNRAVLFNDFFRELADTYEKSESHGSYWAALRGERVKLISDAEAEEGVTEQEAHSFWQKHIGTHALG